MTEALQSSLKKLEAINYGIVVLTKSNVSAPWVNFEAGALAKSIGEARVSTVLVDVTRADIVGPLSQFQDTVLSQKSDVRKLIEDIATAAGANVPQATMSVLFDQLWPALDAAVAHASGGIQPQTDRDSKSILEEVLEVVRAIQRDGSRGVPRQGPVRIRGLDAAMRTYFGVPETLDFTDADLRKQVMELVDEDMTLEQFMLVTGQMWITANEMLQEPLAVADEESPSAGTGADASTTDA